MIIHFWVVDWHIRNRCTKDLINSCINMTSAIIPRFAFYNNLKKMVNKIIGSYTYIHDDDDDGADQSGQFVAKLTAIQDVIYHCSRCSIQGRLAYINCAFMVSQRAQVVPLRYYFDMWECIRSPTTLSGWLKCRYRQIWFCAAYKYPITCISPPRNGVRAITQWVCWCGYARS